MTRIFDAIHTGARLWALIRPDGDLHGLFIGHSFDDARLIATGSGGEPREIADGWQLIPFEARLIEQDRPRVLTDEQRAEYARLGIDPGQR